jgi:hypothetical protein
MLKFKLLNKEEAINYLDEPDLYLESLTPFYIKKILNKPASYCEFINNFKDSCYNFNDFSYKKIQEYEDRLNIKLQKLKLDIDETVYFILTDGSDNISLPYTKGKAIIVPNKSIIDVKDTSDYLLSYDLTVHEVFHTLSRNNNNLRKSCYKSLGWIDAEKALFPTKILEEAFINPDAVSHDHYLKYINIDGSVSKIAPIMHKNMGNDVFGIFNDELEFIKLAPFSEYKSYNKLWKNTNYNNHPEELSAEHFMKLIVSNKFSDEIIMEKFYKKLLIHFAI